MTRCVWQNEPNSSASNQRAEKNQADVYRVESDLVLKYHPGPLKIPLPLWAVLSRHVCQSNLHTSPTKLPHFPSAACFSFLFTIVCSIKKPIKHFVYFIMYFNWRTIFTILWWFLPYIDIDNHGPCVPSLLDSLPPPSPHPHLSSLSQSTGFVTHQPSILYFIYGNVCASMLFSQSPSSLSMCRQQRRRHRRREQTFGLSRKENIPQLYV